MASTQEIEEQLKIALREIGKIHPWYDKNVGAWIFSHATYPVECGGASAEEVKKKFPLYLREFISQRMKGNLSALTEKKTKGRGGYRQGSGRPKGSSKEAKTRIYLPTDIAVWLKAKEHLDQVRELIHRELSHR